MLLIADWEYKRQTAHLQMPQRLYFCFTYVLCVLNIVWLVSKFKYTLDSLLSLSSALFSLVLATSEKEKSQNYHKDKTPEESIEEIEIRKRIQYLNWAIILNKALAFHLMQKNIYFKKKVENSLKRSSSFDRCQSNPRPDRSIRRWNSWVETN